MSSCHQIIWIFCSLVYSFCFVQNFSSTLSTDGNTANGSEKIDWDNDSRLWQYKQEFERIFNLSNHQEKGDCHCDLNSDECDLECCCDSLCTRTELYSFRQCANVESSNYELEPLQCHQKYRQYRRGEQQHQKTPRRLFNSFDQMNCLISDNTQSKRSYVDPGTIHSIEQAETLMQQNSKYFKLVRWTIERTPIVDDQIVLMKNFSQMSSLLLKYKSGSRIIHLHISSGAVSSDLNSTKQTIKNSTFFGYDFWRLPCFSSVSGQEECSSFKHVQYLYNFESECLRPIRLARDCLAASAKWMNYRTFLKSGSFVHNDFIRHRYQLIKVQLINANDTLIEPSYDATLGLCRNLASEINYTVWHSGIFGPDKVQLSIKLTDVSLKQSPLYLKQKFLVEFKKTTSINKTLVLKMDRKPNPKVYSLGSRVLFSTTAGNGLLNQTQAKLNLVPEKLIGLYQNGDCSGSKIKDSFVLFGIDYLGTCRLRLPWKELLDNPEKRNTSQICSIIESAIGKVLGNQSSINLMVSAITGASLDSNHSWVPAIWNELSVVDRIHHLQQQNQSTCSNVTLGLSYDFFYSPSERPNRFRIFGATITKQVLRNFILPGQKCFQDDCQPVRDFIFDLSTTVNFIRSIEPTSSSIRIDYSPAPSFRLELPEDFFYPFQPSTSSSYHSGGFHSRIYFLVFLIPFYYLF